MGIKSNRVILLSKMGFVISLLLLVLVGIFLGLVLVQKFIIINFGI